MGCQKEIARTILKQGGDYVLAVKGNQPTLYEQVRGLMDEGIRESFQWMRHDDCVETDGGHGRIETRRVWTTPDVQWLKGMEDWPGLRSLAVVEATREVHGKTSRERRYFISSLNGQDAQATGAAIRAHWRIENQLHWSLDVSFREDDCRIRKGHAAENFSRLRRIALNLLMTEKSVKVGVHAKRLKAGWNHDYLLRVLRL